MMNEFCLLKKTIATLKAYKSYVLERIREKKKNDFKKKFNK